MGDHGLAVESEQMEQYKQDRQAEVEYKCGKCVVVRKSAHKLLNHYERVHRKISQELGLTIDNMDQFRVKNHNYKEEVVNKEEIEDNQDSQVFGTVASYPLESFVHQDQGTADMIFGTFTNRNVQKQGGEKINLR